MAVTEQFITEMNQLIAERDELQARLVSVEATVKDWEKYANFVIGETTAEKVLAAKECLEAKKTTFDLLKDNKKQKEDLKALREWSSKQEKKIRSLQTECARMRREELKHPAEVLREMKEKGSQELLEKLRLNNLENDHLKNELAKLSKQVKEMGSIEREAQEWGARAMEEHEKNKKLTLTIQRLQAEVRSDLKSLQAKDALLMKKKQSIQWLRDHIDADWLQWQKVVKEVRSIACHQRSYCKVVLKRYKLTLNLNFSMTPEEKASWKDDAEELYSNGYGFVNKLGGIDKGTEMPAKPGSTPEEEEIWQLSVNEWFQLRQASTGAQTIGVVSHSA